MTEKRDLRRHARPATGGDIRVYWETAQGNGVYTRGRCLNISEAGLSAEVADPVPVRTYVRFQITQLRFQGTASVRYCRRRGLRCILGLEFSESTRYTPSP